MGWIDGDKTPVPTWLFKQWSHSHASYKLDNTPWDQNRVGGCAIVGLYDSKSLVDAVKCEKEVADILCQPA